MVSSPTSEWRTSEASEQFDTFSNGVRHYYNALSLFHDPNEAVTEQELIRPVLELLGWADYLPQQGASRNEDIPDLLLFPDAEAKGRAIARPSTEERYQDAVVVEESKRFGLPLDARGPDGRRRATTPHDQIVRYLSTAETESGWPHQVGGSDQWWRVASLRLPRPSPGLWLLRG